MPSQITGLRDLRREPRKRNAPWIYLGTRLRLRDEADLVLGPENRLPIGQLLAREQARLRRPFLDLVASIGSMQKDTLGWWSSRLCWKLWAASDLLLLVCFQSIARELERKGSSVRIVVEDPWLLAQLTGQGRGKLRSEKLRLWLLGLSRRAWWLFNTVPAVLRQRKLRAAPKGENGSRPAAALCSFPLSSGKADQWQDLHLPGLEELLQSKGWEVLRFAAPGCPGFEETMASRDRRFRSLAAYAAPADIFRSVTARWKPVWPADPQVDGLPVRLLLERERWLDAGRAAHCGYRFFYETLDRLLARERWSWIVTCYENQPWEKLLALAARKRGVRVAGIQTAILSRDYLSYLSGKADPGRMTLPDVLCASGPYAREIMAEGEEGPPVRLCGSIRYPELPDQVSRPPQPAPPARSQVLVVLPIYPPMCDDLLDALQRAFPDGGAFDKITFRVRPHPLYPVDPSRWGFKPAALSSFGDAKKAQQESGLVLFTGSTVGFEAMALFRPVLRYRPELSLDPDAEVYGPEVPVCGPRELRETLLRLVRDGPPPGWEETCRRTVLNLFAPYDPSVLTETFVVE